MTIAINIALWRLKDPERLTPDARQIAIRNFGSRKWGSLPTQTKPLSQASARKSMCIAFQAAIDLSERQGS
jgi:hypothetical protein